jgi:hypothetical protein
VGLATEEKLVVVASLVTAYGDSLKVVNVQLSLERLELGLSEPPDEEGLVDHFSHRAVRRQRRPKHVNGYGDESELTWEGHH